jgi:ABC-2 type transport system permease protein
MLDALTRILSLARKELLAVLKDRRSRMSLLVPPIVQALIFGYAATYDLTNVPYAVLDQSRCAASSALLAKLDGSGVFHRVANLDRATDIEKYINEQRALLVIQIGQDFDRQLALNQPAAIQVIADGRNSNTAAIATGYVGTVVGAFNAQWVASHGGSGGGAPATPTISVETRAWYNPNLETRWAFIPSLIVTLTLNQGLLLTAMSVVREREDGTLDQLLVTPFTPSEIMIGKTLPSMLVATIQATNALLVAQLWFRIPFAGSFVVLYTGIIVFLLATVGIGLFVSSIAQTMQQAMIYSMVMILPFSLLSGLTTPLSSMPKSLQYLTLINPLRYAIDLARRVYLEGAGYAVIASDLWPMALIAVVTLAAATLTFRLRVR